MPSSILVLNAGSSSIKFALFRVGRGEPGERFLRGQVAGIRERPQLVFTDRQGKHTTPLDLGTDPREAPSRALNALLD